MLVDRVLNIGDLLTSLGVIGMDTGNAAAVAKAVKVKSITIWGTPKSDSDHAKSEAFIDWHSSSGFSSGNKKQDVSLSNAKPCYVHSKPPRGSLCEFWCELGTVQYCTVRVPAGGVIDVAVDWKQAEDICYLVTGTLLFDAGKMLFGKLDGPGGNLTIMTLPGYG